MIDSEQMQSRGMKIVDGCPVTAVLSLQARSRHADSSVLKIEVSWDGRWNDGEVEMGRHLVLKPALASVAKSSPEALI